MIKRVYIPKPLLKSPASLARAVRNALTGAAKGAQIDYQTTTRSWRQRPAFTIQEPDPTTRIIGTDDEIYAYVDQGTRPHLIRPRRKRVLTFMGPYRAKTQRRVIGSGSGGTGSDIIYARAVQHPGTEAREFSETIAEKWQDELPTTLQRAIDAEMS